MSIDGLMLCLLAALILVLGMHFAIYFRYAVGALFYPFQLDYGEGIVWQQALLIPGPRMYGDITRFPFIVFHYPPAYHLAVRAVAALGIDMLRAGRGVSLASSLAVGVLAASLVFQAARGRFCRLASLAGAAFAGLSIFCYWPVVVWSPMFRVDMLAIALSFLGVWFAVRSPPKPWQPYVAVLLFVLAAYTKQSCIVAPLTVLPVMLMIDYGRSIKAYGLGLAVGVAALSILTEMTGGGFLRHILLYNLNRYSVTAAVRAIAEQWPHAFFLLLAISAIGVGWKRLASTHAWIGFGDFRRTIRNCVATRLMAVMTVYFVLSTGMLATLGKSGGALNYMIEWMCVWSVLIGTLIASVTERALAGVRLNPTGAARGSLSILLLLLPVMLMVQVMILPATRDLPASDPVRRQQLEQLLTRVKDAKQPVLSDDMVLLLKAGKQVPWEPAIFAELASTGRWDERRIIDMIDAHDFAFVITTGSHGMPLYDSRYTPGVSQAIETAYPRDQMFAGYHVHSRSQ